MHLTLVNVAFLCGQQRCNALHGGLPSLRSQQRCHVAVAMHDGLPSLRSTPVATPSVASLSFMARLKSCGARRDWPEVLVVLEELRESEVSADSFHYTAAMTVGNKVGEWQAVLALLDQLIDSGVQLDLGCFNAALAACATAGRPIEARALLERMPLCGVRPSAACYSAVGKAHAAAGDWRGALECFDEIGHNLLEPSFSDYKKAIAAANAGSDLHRIVCLTVAARELRPAPRRKQREWLWRLWSVAQLRLLRRQLERTLPAVDQEATARLQRSLSEAAHHGAMPSFEDDGARSGYTLAHLAPRASKLADLLQLEDPAWLRAAVVRAIRHARSGGGGVALSIAGGPGFDLAALALLVDFGRLDELWLPEKEAAHPLHVRVLDYEPGWDAQVGAMARALRRRFAATPLRCSFGSCDITQPLAHASNAAVCASLPSSRLLVASYCVSENAISLRESGFVFFEDLARAAEPGTLVLVLETTHRQFPALVAAARRGAGAQSLEIDCPWVRSNNGFSLCLLKKDATREAVAAESDAVEVGSGAGVELESAAAARCDEQQAAALHALFERFDRDEVVHARSRGTRTFGK